MTFFAPFQQRCSKKTEFEILAEHGSTFCHHINVLLMNIEH